MDIIKSTSDSTVGANRRNTMITQRTSQEVTQQELEIFQKVCAEKNVVMHQGNEREQNILTIGDFIIDQWKVIITEETMSIAIQKLGEANRISFYTQIEA